MDVCWQRKMYDYNKAICGRCKDSSADIRQLTVGMCAEQYVRARGFGHLLKGRWFMSFQALH